MRRLVVVSHPEVVVESECPIPEWGLSALGRARAEQFAKSETLSSIGAIWSSPERKAQETATILAKSTGRPVHVDARLGENDRTATGFLAPPQFEAAADAFFAEPDRSFRGWETASAAQERIVQAIKEIAAGHQNNDLVIATHGAVGTLLWCHLSGEKIDRRFDQPAQGHFWCAALEDLRPMSRWQPIA